MTDSFFILPYLVLHKAMLKWQLKTVQNNWYNYYMTHSFGHLKIEIKSEMSLSVV